MNIDEQANKPSFVHLDSSFRKTNTTSRICFADGRDGWLFNLPKRWLARSCSLPGDLDETDHFVDTVLQRRQSPPIWPCSRVEIARFTSRLPQFSLRSVGHRHCSSPAIRLRRRRVRHDLWRKSFPPSSIFIKVGGRPALPGYTILRSSDFPPPRPPTERQPPWLALFSSTHG